MSDTRGLTLTPLRSVTARLVSHDWAWARDHADDIARNWERRRAEAPDLFDGPVLLAQGCGVEGEACEVAFFETRYSCFIAFRDAGSPDPTVANAFAAIVPETADGAVLLGLMGRHTANAGQIYFPCGTPDRDDVREGARVDLAGSAEREFREETGLPLPPGADAAPWVLVRGQGQLAFLRPVRFPETAGVLSTRMDAHRRREDAPELSRVVVVRGRGDLDPVRMPGFVQAYLDRAFPA